MSKSTRIIGIDFARTLAIIGMIIVNFKIVLGDGKPLWLKDWLSFFDGKAAATFVILAGVGLSLMASKHQTQDARKQFRITIYKRALFLWILGLIFYVFWPADILHYYGIYLFIAASVIFASSRLILGLAIVLILGYLILIGSFPYEQSWNFETYDYADFWTWNGFIRHLIYNGFHPVIPWASFILYGVWLGRQDLRDEFFVRKAFRLSGMVFLMLQVCSWLMLGLYSDLPSEDYESIRLMFELTPMPPLPFYMLGGMAIGTFIITGSILLSDRYISKKWVHVIANTGRLALSIYILHVFLGMYIVFIIKWEESTGLLSLSAAFIYSLVFGLLAILASNWYLKRKSVGPFEWLMRKWSS